MPNHVTNILTIKGDDKLVKRIKSEIVWDVDPSDPENDGEELPIDFNKIVPRPDSLDIVSGSNTDNGIAVLQYLAGNTKTIDEMVKWPWVVLQGIQTSEELVKFMLETKRADIDAANIALDNVRNYGHKDWYSWCIDKWGTKWNAYTQSVSEDGDIIFQTAWSNPYPIIAALSSKYPDAEFTLRYADEDLGQNVGEYTMVDGIIVDEDIPDEGSEDALLMAVEICEWDEYISDRCFEIDPEYSVDDLEEYDKKWISIAYRKDVLDDYPKCALDYMLKLAVDDENYEFAQRIKDTTSWYEVE
jgi:hypothetical protein